VTHSDDRDDPRPSPGDGAPLPPTTQAVAQAPDVDVPDARAPDSDAPDTDTELTEEPSPGTPADDKAPAKARRSSGRPAGPWEWNWHPEEAPSPPRRISPADLSDEQRDRLTGSVKGLDTGPSRESAADADKPGREG
jgi:hypothetical protein